MKRRIFAATLSLILAFSVLSGCGEKESGTATESTASYTEMTEAATEKAEETTLTVAEAVTENATVTEITTETVSQTAAEETAAASSLSTVEEIVAYFNTSVNKIKPTAKKVVKNYELRTVNEEKLVLPAGLESTARNMMATLMKDDTEPVVYETREDITNEFIVPEQSYSSRLEPEWVKSATVTDNGSHYIINLKLRDQKNPTAGNGIGAVCDVIEVHEVAEKASFVEKFTADYYNCEIVAQIDKASGNVVKITYITPVALEMRVNMFGTHDGCVGFTFEKDYTITY